MTDKNLFIRTVPEALDSAMKNITDKPTKNIGNTIADIWYLVFGGISQAANKRNLKYYYELQEFEKELQDKIEKISDDKIIEPDLQIVAPALEASKYCVLHKEIRFLFSSLIASSLNLEMCGYIHPSFADIIKQLTPLDAQNILIFKKKEYHPICNYRINFKDKSYDDYYTNVFLSNPNLPDIDMQAISMCSLERLGIVSIKFESKVKFFKYEAFELTKEYKELINDVKKKIIPKATSVNIIKGIVELTPYGKSFIKACT